ncbi:response regulator [bacterium]|nr:response regulator [bacterium]MBU1434610.1 response regulator [bacterium]MBU1502188.1 response regulator [bacterium]
MFSLLNNFKSLLYEVYDQKFYPKFLEDYKKADTLMLYLVLFHWFLASTLSAAVYDTYLFGFLSGGILFLLTYFSHKYFSGSDWHRVLIGIVLMSFSVIFIQQNLGRIEMHFHIFGALAFLTLYKDLKPVTYAALFIVLHHFIFNELQRAEFTISDIPIMIFSYGCGIDIVLLHGFFVLFELVVLILIIYYQIKQFLKVLESQESIRLINENLENIVQERTLELIAAKNRAEEADKMKSEFLANMSHEIRTPMNAVLGFTDILMEHVDDPVNFSYVKSIHSSGKSLMIIINDILDLSKIEAGKMSLHYTPVNPYSLFKDLESVFTNKINEKNLDFIIDLDPALPKSLILDEVRLRQILFNLLGNAVKFTEKGHISLIARKKYTQEDKSLLDMSISIEDTGIGIPLDQQSKIFEAFTQKDGQSAKHFAGTGLGLSISTKLAVLMNGKIDVEANVYNGTTFNLTLHDVSVSSTVVEEDEKQKYEDLNQYRFEAANILLVDDIETNRILVKNYLSRYGLNVIEAENGAEAVRLSHKNIDLILMDIKMPIMNGYEATQRIQSDPETSHIPIIALTASVGENPELDEKNDVFDYFLSKPIDRKTLIEALAKFLKHSKDLLVHKPIEEKHDLSQVLKKKLEENFFDKYQNIIGKGDLDMITEFAYELEKFAKENTSEELEKLAKNLRVYSEGFDIENVEKILLHLNKFWCK